MSHLLGILVIIAVLRCLVFVWLLFFSCLELDDDAVVQRSRLVLQRTKCCSGVQSRGNLREEMVLSSLW